MFESVHVCACVGMGVFVCAQAHLKVCAPCLEAQGGGQLVFPALWLQLGEKAVSWAQVCCYLGAVAAGLLPSPLMGPLLAPGDPPEAQPRQQQPSAQLSLPSQGTSSSPTLPPSLATACRLPLHLQVALLDHSAGPLWGPRICPGWQNWEF